MSKKGFTCDPNEAAALAAALAEDKRSTGGFAAGMFQWAPRARGFLFSRQLLSAGPMWGINTESASQIPCIEQATGKDEANRSHRARQHQAWVRWHLVESNAEEILGLMFEQGRF